MNVTTKCFDMVGNKIDFNGQHILLSQIIFLDVICVNFVFNLHSQHLMSQVSEDFMQYCFDLQMIIVVLS